jgi:hypothetical protein
VKSIDKFLMSPSRIPLRPAHIRSCELKVRLLPDNGGLLGTRSSRPENTAAFIRRICCQALRLYLTTDWVITVLPESQEDQYSIPGLDSYVAGESTVSPKNEGGEGFRPEAASSAQPAASRGRPGKRGMIRQKKNKCVLLSTFV